MKKNVFTEMTEEELQTLRTILGTGITTKEDVINETGYKNTTVSRILEGLKGSGMIVNCGEGESTGGRRPLLYTLNPEKKIYCAGVLIGLYHIDVSLIHYSGRVIDLRTVTNSPERAPEAVLTIIGVLLKEMMSEQRIQKGEIYYAGLSAFCSLSKGDGVVVGAMLDCFEQTDWFGFPLKQAVSDLLGVEVGVETSANAACMGEYLLGKGKHCDNVCFLLCGGGGIRIGCIQKGIIVRPVYNQDNAFGHMVVIAGGEKCECGNYGCIYAYSSVSTIQKRFLTMLKIGRKSILDTKEVDSITILDILQAADSGDPLSAEVITQAATTLAVGIANYINLTSPSVFICGGILIEKCSLFYEVIKDRVNDRVPFLRDNGDIFQIRSQYGKPAVGDGLLAVEAMFGRRC